MDTTRRLRALLGALAATAALVAAGCGDSGDEEPAGGQAAAAAPADKDATAAELVPEEIREDGKLTIATNAPYAPLEFFADDNKTLIGFDIDIGDAIGAELDLDVEWKNVAFDSIIPGLAASRYDIGIAGFSVERERLDVVDFVSYYLSGGGFLVKKGSGIEVNDFKDTICGYRVAVQKGVSQVDKLKAAVEYCKSAGKEPPSILEIPDQNVVVLTLRSGRADIVVADKPQVEYAAAHSDGEMCVTGTYRTTHSIAGIAVPKRLAELSPALQRAVQQLIDSGKYQEIAKKWGTGVEGEAKEIAPDYEEIAEPWGVGPDGSVRESKIFTDPDEIQPGEDIFPQPIRAGCA